MRSQLSILVACINGKETDALKEIGKLTKGRGADDQIASWAEDDFHSVNGQIEYLLTECVKQRKKNGKYVSDTMDEPIELDIK